MRAAGDPPRTPPQRKVIEDAIAEIDETLRAASPSAAVRELRVRHGALARVVRAWGQSGPHEQQLGAMMECVLELKAAVAKACPRGPAPRGLTKPPPSRAQTNLAPTRPPPRRAAANLTTRPPPRATGGTRAGTAGPLPPVGTPPSRRG